jgi:hypothetical protein
MKRWQRIRLGLRVVAAMALAGAQPVGTLGGGIWAALLLAFAAGASALSLDLPRDAWTPAELEAFRKRKRTTTRSNPIAKGAGGDQ